MLKIMFFLYSFSGGGAERTVLNILNNLDKTKFNPILVLGTKKDAPYLENMSSEIKIINLETSRLRKSLLALRKCINQEKPDILFSTVNPNNIVLSIAKVFSKQRRKKMILREANNRTESGKVGILNKIITYITYNFIADEIVALSKGVKDDLVTNFKISKNKISVIYNPVEVEFIKKKSAEPIEELKHSIDVKRIITVGRLVEQKDYPTLFHAIKKLKNQNIQLLILGKGVLEDKLKKMCQELGVQDKVLFLGFQNNPYKYISQSDLFVLPSKWEGFGHVLVEAMASGTPVISSNCNSGPFEIIEDNKYGVLFPVGDYMTLAKKIEEMLDDDNLRDQYVIKGYTRAESFSAQKIVKEYERLFST